MGTSSIFQSTGGPFQREMRPAFRRYRSVIVLNRRRIGTWQQRLIACWSCWGCCRHTGSGRVPNLLRGWASPSAPCAETSKESVITAQSALAKFEQLLPTALRRRVSALETLLQADTPRAPRVSQELLGTLALACRDSERLRFSYEDARGVPSDGVAEPHALAWIPAGVEYTIEGDTALLAFVRTASARAARSVRTR